MHKLHQRYILEKGSFFREGEPRASTSYFTHFLSSARDIFTAESVYLVLNFCWIGSHGEPVERLQQRNDVVRFTFFSPQYEASITILYAAKAMDRGSRLARKEGIVAVEA